MHALIDLQRSALRFWVEFALLSLPKEKKRAPAGLNLEFLRRNLEAGQLQTWSLRTSVARDLGARVEERVLATAPFMRLVRLRAHGSSTGQAPVLLVAPFSGYAAAVLSPLIAGLIGERDVIVTDWRDARLVPDNQGPFDLTDQTRIVEAQLERLGPAVHLIGLSQSAVPALGAVALLAARAPERQPLSLTLLGGPVDPGAGSGSFHDWLKIWWPDQLDGEVFTRVGPGFPGTGREVYPSLNQLFLIIATHPAPYLSVQAGAWIELAGGPEGGFARSLDDMHKLIDTPAELVRQMMVLVFRERALAAGTWRIDGRTVDPGAIERTALLTVEGGADALVGRGQTHAAHRLVGRSGARPDDAVTIEGIGHADLFTGWAARLRIAPLLQRFMSEADADAVPRG